MGEKANSITVHTDEEIKGFFGEYRWLSNYYSCKVFYKGREFTSSEAAYQSAKQTDPEIVSFFQTLTGKESKEASRHYSIPPDWDDIKTAIMYEILYDKFTRNSELKEKLIATGDRYLEETNWWGDEYWGVCKGKGENVLGKILMKIRSMIDLQ